jgi:hypothetical protein
MSRDHGLPALVDFRRSLPLATRFQYLLDHRLIDVLDIVQDKTVIYA